ncbi:CdaR family protein [Pontimicrobium aquaticum]|uniref:YbbR-like domain-containing protein n=1 Tax=Pontimicrobium aquaticum TaxID=2565367 RepID=A0A4U0EXG1_9FLAO|nr:YbbR-like domain-containing protein [Pontimicrobium aquaticum]TJY36074.1 YbbR-like domain-containing protein [Pontimicrobium aquaticum]
MKVFKQNIISHIKSKRLNVFFLFLILAFLFSVLSKLSQRYTHSFVFTINKINVPENHVILSDSNTTMNIVLNTYGFKHIKYYFKQPTIDIDFSLLDKTGTHYKWIESNGLPNIINQFDTNIRVENITPDTIAFRYDVNAIKKVPVKLLSNIKYSTGYDVINSYKLEPDSVKIIGPKIMIDSITQIQTKNVKLENVNTSFSEIIELDIPNSNNLMVSKSTVKVSGTVEKFTEGTLNVPVNIINVPEHIKINFYPKSVPLVFYTSLSNFNNISTNNFIVQCDFNTIKNNTHLIPEIIKQPDNIKYAKLNVKQIEFVIIK